MDLNSEERKEAVGERENQKDKKNAIIINSEFLYIKMYEDVPHIFMLILFPD